MAQREADTLLNCIYDAVADDAALNALPGLIAAIAGGRSCFAAIHYPNQILDMLCSAGYNMGFMTAYATHFILHDPWAPIAACLRDNRFHNMERHLPKRELLSSAFYNEMQKLHHEDVAHITVIRLAGNAGGGDS